MTATVFAEAEAERAGEYEHRGDYHRQPDPSWRYYPVYMEKMAVVRRYLDARPASARTVDLGCGEGLLVEEYRAKGHDIRGVDLSYSSDHVERGDITALHFDDASFDLAMALDVIEHLDFGQQERAFAEMHRVLRPGGRALVSLPNLAHFASRLSFLLLGRLVRTSDIERHPGDRPIHEYLQLIRSCGFELRERRGLFPTFPLVSLLTYFAPARALPVHRLYNALAAQPGLCFLNILELERPG